jgi:2-dehydro-3-deoxygluconokinase
VTDLVSLGEPLVEFNDQGEGRWLQGFGGDTSNVAIAAARQGARAAMIAHIGRDEFGDGLMALWAREGVDARHVVRRDAPTGLYFVHHRPEGHVFSYRRAGSAASLMRPDDLPADAIRGARVLHVSGISQAISPSAADATFAALAIARAAGVMVSYDPNLRLRLWPLDRARAVIHETMRHVDIALPGIDDVRGLSGLDDPHECLAFYRALGPRIVVLKLGAEGALVADGDAITAIPPRPARLVDASGAGDCFDGSFLARILAGDGAVDAARYANTAASLKVERYGAIAGIPRKDAVAAVM